MQQGQKLSAVTLSEQNTYDPKPDIVSDHDARVIFRQNVPRDVQVAFDPQRDSQSYATAKTNQGSLSDHESESDWTTCSDTDSEYAQTWPPRNQAAYHNEQLPKQEVSPVDHVAQWIKKTSSYIPTHIQGRPNDDMDIGKIRAKSEPRDPKASGNKISRFFRAASLPRSKEALLKFCNFKSQKRHKVTPPKVKEDDLPINDSGKPEEKLKPSITISTNMDIIKVLSEESIV
jgi:hypothetical protein